MWWFICFRTYSDKIINEIMPHRSRGYTLTQFKSPEYDSIEECLLEEISLPQKTIENLIAYYKSFPRWDEIKNSKLDNLKDPQNTLTEDERFAFALYSIDSYFFTTLSQVLDLGTTGQFNCYFNYLKSGFDKLKNDLPDSCPLYRGITRTGYSVNDNNYKKDDIVYSTSFTSTSKSFENSLVFAQSYLVFFILSHKNSRSIQQLSFYSREEEYLYPPATKFRVIKDPYTIPCYYNTIYNRTSCDLTEETNYSYKVTIIELLELNEEYGPIKIDESTNILNDNCKYKNVAWWGWLLVGVAVGICLVGLVFLLVFLIRGCIYHKYEKSEIEKSEITVASNF